MLYKNPISAYVGNTTQLPFPSFPEEVDLFFYIEFISDYTIGCRPSETTLVSAGLLFLVYMSSMRVH